jgi:hypothetical protein
MSTHHWDYIPAKDSELMPWSANFTEQVAANASAWGIPPDEVAALQTANDTFAALQKQADSPARTTIIVAKKDAARKTLVGIIRSVPATRTPQILEFTEEEH